MITTALYVLCVIIANLVAGILVPVGAISFSLGTLFFAPIFTLRDALHEQRGRRYVYGVIAVAVLINAVIAALGAVDARVIDASCVALFISEATDTEVFHRLKTQHPALRIIASNTVSVPLDTALFLGIAFGGAWPWSLLLTVLATDTMIKYSIAAGVLPAWLRLRR